jgi:hypothetical protein
VHDVAMRIGEEFFTVDCYVIPLDCHDMVLGVAWLRAPGPYFETSMTYVWPSRTKAGTCSRRELAPPTLTFL